jgi:Zn-dependent peptidase ImmA (M78 family)
MSENSEEFQYLKRQEDLYAILDKYRRRTEDRGSPVINPLAFAKSEGIIVRKVDLSGVSDSDSPDSPIRGVFLRNKEGTNMIYTALDAQPQEIRFLVAHELGHYFIEKEKREEALKNDVILDFTHGFKVRAVGAANYADEMLANDFALDLLMPEATFREIYESKARENDRIDELAFYFGVQKELIEARIRDFGFE